MLFTIDQLKLIEILAKLAQESNVQIALVGGVVRDIFLGHSVEEKDFDFVLSGDIYGFADRLTSSLNGELQKFEKFLTAKIIEPKLIPSLAEVDLAHARKETYLKPGELPNVMRAEIDDDLMRRDFSINAMAIPLPALWHWLQSSSDLEELYAFVKDPYKGRIDLANKLVRVLHAESFKDDPTRIFRALRYVARINGELEKDTEQLLGKALKEGNLQTISMHRILNELKYIFAEKNFLEAFALLCKYKVFDVLELVPKNLIDQLHAYVDKLSQLKLGSSADMNYQIFLRVCFAVLAQDEREAFVRRIGLGRKTYNAFVKDLNFSSLQPNEYSKALRRVLEKN